MKSVTVPEKFLNSVAFTNLYNPFIFQFTWWLQKTSAESQLLMSLPGAQGWDTEIAPPLQGHSSDRATKTALSEHKSDLLPFHPYPDSQEKAHYMICVCHCFLNMVDHWISANPQHQTHLCWRLRCTVNKHGEVTCRKGLAQVTYHYLEKLCWELDFPAFNLNLSI